MNTPIDVVLERLRDYSPRRSGSGWTARCPAHDDRRPSLSVREGADGRALLYCHAGCSPQAVCSALGLRLADLMAARGDGNGQAAASLTAIDAGPAPRLPDAAARAIARYARKAGLGKPVAAWGYHDASGNLVGLTVRWNTPGGKTVRPFSLHGGRWRCKAMPAPRPLYALPEILRGDAGTLIAVTEGEKVAEAARRCGLAGTASSGGAKAAVKADWSPLRGRRVVVLPDHDAAGETYALDVARLATAAGAREVKIVRLRDFAPELPEGGDLADILDSPDWCGLPLAESATPEDVGRYILAAAEGIEPWRPEPAPSPAAARPAEAFAPVALGTVVFARDRGNYGKVLEDLGGSCRVHFVNPATGDEATVELPKTLLATQDGRALAGKAEPFDLELITGAELLKRDCRIECLIKGALVRGQHTLLGGPIKSCKSLIATDLACCLAAGTPWLGHFEVPRPVRTILLNGEAGWPVLQESIRRVSESAGASEAALAENLLVGVRLPKFGDPVHVGALRSAIEKHKAEVVILDCAYRSIPGDQASNLFMMGELLDSIGRVFEDAGATLVLLHHSPKHIPPGEPLELDNLAFAGFGEFAAAWILVNRQQPYEPGSGYHKLWLTVGARAGISGAYSLTIDEGEWREGEPRGWRVEVGKATDARAERRREQEAARAARQAERDQRDLDAARRAIVEAMVKLGKPAERAAVQARTPIQRARFVRAWTALEDDGLIIEAGTVRKPNGHEYPTYRVAECDV